MSRPRWSPPAPASKVEVWKPDKCEVPGCEATWPCFSLSGTQGPWLCLHHYKNPPQPGGEQGALI